MVVVVVVRESGRGGGNSCRRGHRRRCSSHGSLVLPNQRCQVPLLLLPVLLDLLHPPVVRLHLLLEHDILKPCSLLIKLYDANAVQSLQVQVASPQHAHAVHNKVGLDVHLERKRRR